MKSSPKLKVIAIIISLIVFFTILNLTGFSGAIKNFFYTISSPIQKTLWQTGDKVSDFFEAITEIKNLKNENEELRTKNQELFAEISSLKELKKENEILREALGVGLEKNFNLILAKVIGKDVSDDVILIDKGVRDGVAKGMPVITQQKVVLGKISEVYDNFSRVSLISSKGQSFDAKIQEKDIVGLIRGGGNFKIFLDLIPRDKEISNGDTVLTRALGGIFPEGLLVGKIKTVLRSDTESFQQGEIEPFFDIKEIDRLFIIIGNR